MPASDSNVYWELEGSHIRVISFFVIKGSDTLVAPNSKQHPSRAMPGHQISCCLVPLNIRLYSAQSLKGG